MMSHREMRIALEDIEFPNVKYKPNGTSLQIPAGNYAILPTVGIVPVEQAREYVREL